jgi:small GTP-binding protein
MAHHPKPQQTGPKPIKVCLVGQAHAGKTCLVGRFQTGSYEPDQVTIGVSFTPCTIAIDKSTLEKSQFQFFLSRFFSNPDHKAVYPEVPQPKQDVIQNRNGTSTTTTLPPTEPNILHTRLNIWDTAGHERYAKITKKYYHEAEACLICYDLTDQESWEKLQNWVQEVQSTEPDCLLIFVGTKKDFLIQVPKSVKDRYPHDQHLNEIKPRAVNVDEVRDYALSVGAVVFETSAKFDNDLPYCDHTFELFNFIAHEVQYRRNEDEKLGLNKQNQNINQIDLNQNAPDKPGGCC